MVDAERTGAELRSERRTGGIEQWLLLDGNRFAIAAGVAVAFGLAYLVLSVGDVAPLATQALFSARTRSA